MNQTFTGNPIAVKHNGKTIGVIELDLDYSLTAFVLSIYDQAENLLFKGAVDEETFLSIDTSVRVVTLLYEDLRQREILFRRQVNLVEEYHLEDRESGKTEQAANDKQLFEVLSAIVKEQMDNPSGTALETEFHTKMLKNTTMDKEARDYVESKIRHIVATNAQLNDSQINDFTSRIYSEFYGMGILQEIDDDPDVGEIMVNGFEFPVFRCDIYYIKHGMKVKYPRTFKNIEDLQNVYGRAISFSRKELNNLENAIVEATRANRDRVNILIPDASESWALNIRKFGNFVPDMSNMRSSGTVNEEIERIFEVIVAGKANIGIGGEMGTGKTTMINYLLTYTEPIERKVVIASINETDVDRVLAGHDILILNVDEDKKFTFKSLLRAALRTTASRIIVPESRGEEFKQVYEANLKTKGNMFSAHALEDEAYLDMCVDMYDSDGKMDVKNLKDKIAKSLDIIIIMRKVGDKIRIKSISELTFDEHRRYNGMNLLYYWFQDPDDPNDPTKGEYRRMKNRFTPELKARLNENGVPMSKLKDL